ncbi:cysteine hydrolase family protein [Patulibacter minatonensis]|uniref:cysteine hydrolase family protein n=1 Tax=Patulibacter minatonensis TaxID=298163 RepID=UPI00047D1DFB|nr:isochorismatase family cysteine hydrolase [Patulibacter minatonensis]
MSTPHDQTALLVMDLQSGIADGFEGTGLIERVAAATDAARAAGMPVIFVKVEFRDGAPEVSTHNRMFGAMLREGRIPTGVDLHPALGVRDDEIVVTKRRVSAFAGSDLDVVLRAKGIGHLVLAGISTSGVVLSTLRQAADLDLGLVVLADGCGDRDDEVHRVLTEKVFPRQARVTDVATWTADLGKRG